jgi:hypothetical protein
MDDANILNFRPESPVKRTLAAGGFEADFYLDKTQEVAMYHYIVTRKGMAEIFAWGRESSMADAERSARLAMDSLHARVVRAAG